MGVRRLAVGIAVLCMVLGMCDSASASSQCPGDDNVPTQDNAADAAFSLVCDINALRAQNNLPPLRWDWQLWAASQGMANDMSAHHFASHIDSAGRTVIDRVIPTGYTGDS